MPSTLTLTAQHAPSFAQLRGLERERYPSSVESKTCGIAALHTKASAPIKMSMASGLTGVGGSQLLYLLPAFLITVAVNVW